MSKLGLLAAILVITGPAVAQASPVHATVVDGVTLDPVPNAVVTIGTRALAANERGELTLDLERATDVTATADGYEPATQTIDPRSGDGAPMILLFTTGSLEVIAIKAQAPRSVTDGAYTIGRDEIRNLPGGSTDALAAVRSLPGVSHAPPVAGGRLVIRGGAPQDSLLTIDGVPVPFVYHSFDNTTILPVSMIGSIAYSPGGFGVDEGRATSGTVAIGTTEELPRTPTAMGQLSMLDVSAAAAMPLSIKHGLSLSGAVRRSTVDVLLPLTVPEDLMVSFTTAPRFHDAQLRLDWQPNARDRVAILALTSYDRAGVVNHMPDSDLPADLDLEAEFGRVIASWKHEHDGVRNRLVGAVGTGALHSTFDTIQHIDDVERMALLRDDLSIDLGGVRVRAGAIAQLDHHRLDARSIVIPTEGLPPGHFDDLPIHTISAEYDSSYAGSYLSGEIKPTTSTTITAGARLDHFARIAATVFEPRIELAQRAGDITLRGSAGRYARDLDQVQALSTDLRPELATQISGGAEIKLAEGLSASATLYHTRRDQLAIEDTRMAAVDEIPYTSTGSGSSGGIDLLLRASREHAFGWIAYSFGKTSRRDRPEDPAHATSFDQTHALSVVGSYQVGAWRFGARFAYQSGLPYTEVVGGTYSEQLGRYLPVLGTPNGARYPDVAQLDLRVERQWKTKHVDLAAFIDFGNVFRQAHVHRYQYTADFSQKEALTEYVPLPSLGIRGEI